MLHFFFNRTFQDVKKNISALEVVIVTPKYKFPTPELKTGAQDEASIIEVHCV